MNIINLTMHPATPEQRATGIVDVSDRAILQDLLNIPEEELRLSDEELDAHLDARIAEIIKRFVLPAQKKQNEPVWAMVGGAPILMELLIPALRDINVVAAHALSARQSVETTTPDGKVVKRSVFSHIRLRPAHTR